MIKRLQPLAKILLPFITVYIFVKIIINNTFIAEYVFARGIGRFFTIVLQKINSIIPFSIIETGFVLIILILLAVIAIELFKDINISNRFFIRFLKGLCIFMFTFVIGYNITATANYNRLSVIVPLGLNTDIEVTDTLMVDAATYYLDRLLEVEEKLQRDSIGNIIVPYSFSEINDLLATEYKKLDKNYFTKNTIKLKQITFSKLMTYTGITGVYVGILGEGSINTNIPPYTLASTMAHEMAHSKGVMHENEANFVSYYICINSDNDYLQYSGLMEAFIKCYSTITDVEQKKIIRQRIPDSIITEYNNEYDFFQEYQGVVQKIANFFNNLNLKASGVSDGVKSYGMTDKFLVALYEQLTSV